jgi:hypothetical protein
MTEIITHNTKELAERILRGIVTAEELASAKLEDVVAIKRSEEPHWITCAMTPSKGSRERSLRYLASDETPDRAGDIIKVAGWDFKDFKRNPVALWGHNSYGFPIGRVFDIDKSKDGGEGSKPALFESIEYATPEMNPEAEFVYRLADGGFLNAVSVGFVPVKTAYPATPEERSAMGLGPYGVLFEKQQQIELSQCSIPCNPNALGAKAVALVKEHNLDPQAATRILDALGIPTRTVFSVPDISGIRADPETDPLDETPELELLTLDQVRAELAAFKAEVLAAINASQAATKQEIHTLREKIARRVVRTSTLGKPPAVDVRHEEKPTQADKGLSLLDALRSELKRGSVAGGSTTNSNKP